MKNTKTVLTIVFIIFAAYTIYEAEGVKAETIEGNKVYVDNAKLYFEAEPHTIKTGDDTINFKLISKQFGGNIDVAFGFDTSIIKPKSAEIYKNGQWNDISNSFNPINYNYNEMNKWYVAESVNINQNQEYNLRINFNMTSLGSGKYWVCAKPSAQSISQAISSGNFLCLDPWFNVSFFSKFPLTGNVSSGQITMPILLNDTNITINNAVQTVWCNYTLNASNRIIGYVYYNDEFDYVCVNEEETAEVEMHVERGDRGDNGNPYNESYTYVGDFNTTSALDSSIYGNDPLALNDNPESVDGIIAKGLSFNGINQSIELNNDTVTTYTRGTVMMWANVAEWKGGEFDGLAGDPNGQLLFFYDGGGAGIRCSINNLWQTDFTEPTTGIFQHYALTWDSVSNVARCYVNGVIVSAFTDPFNTPNMTQFWVGSWLDGTSSNRCINATIDQVEILNISLTQNEIIARYENQRGIFNFTETGEVINRSGNTSMLAVPFDITDFSFSSSTFVPGIFVSFNTTKPSTNLSVLSSMNVEKLSGGGTNIITARILLDDDIILTEELRTVTGTGDVGSTGLSPVRFDVANGEHNITVEFARTGAGSILIDNIDFNLLEFLSNTDEPIRSQLINMSYSFSSQTFIDAFNWTMGKLINSTTYMTVKQTVSKITSGISELGFRFFNLQENDTSPSWFRTLSSASDIGSLAGVYIDPNKIGIHNNTIQSKQSDVGDTVTVNGTILDFDLSDFSEFEIQQFQETNESINESNTSSFGEGIHLLVTKNMTILDGDSFFLSATTSFSTSTGSQTINYVINSTQANCGTEKDRTISSNNDIGNVFMYDICENLTIGETYTFNLYLIVQAGEIVEQIDESFNGFETISFSIIEGNLPPIPNEITNPQDGDNVTGLDTITWRAFMDPNNGTITYNISLFNLDGTFNRTINNATTDIFTPVNWDSFQNTTYDLVVEGCDPTDLCANSTITITLFRLPVFIPLSSVFCSSNTTLLVRDVSIEDNNGQINITIDDNFILCLNGCSNNSITNLGNPGCVESDLTLWIIALVVVILLVLLFKGINK